jgi:cytochrome c peroxidase
MATVTQTGAEKGTQASTASENLSQPRSVMALASCSQTNEGFLRQMPRTWGRRRATGAPHTLAPPYLCQCNRTWGRRLGRHTRLGRSPGQSTL